MKRTFLGRYVCHSSYGVLKPPIGFVKNQLSIVTPHLPVTCSYDAEDDSSCKGCNKSNVSTAAHV